MADLINRGKVTVADGDALMDELGQRRLQRPRPATFAVPVAVSVPADTRPAAAMAHLDDTVQRAVAAMAWTTLHDDPDGYAIDTPHRPDTAAGRRRSPAGSDLVLVHATIRLTVTVAAYVLYQFAGTAQNLLDEDLEHLHDAGVETGPARRAPATADEDIDDDPESRTDREDSVVYDYYGYHGDPDSGEPIDPPDELRHPLYRGVDLFDDPADPLFIGDGTRVVNQPAVSRHDHPAGSHS